MSEERPVHPSVGPVARFALELRKFRQSHGLTYGQLSRQTYFSKTVMWEADHGKSLPSSDVTAAFVRACDGDVEEWLRKRKAIEEEIRPSGKQKPSIVVPAPRQVPRPDPRTARVPEEYIECLKRLVEWAGLSLREIARRTNDLPRRVAPSTLCEAYKRQTLPAIDIVTSVVAVVGITESDQEVWITRWHEINEGRAKRPDANKPARKSIWHRQPTEAHEAAQQELAPTRRVPSPRPGSAKVSLGWPWSSGNTLEMPLVTEEIRDWELVDGAWRPFEIAGRTGGLVIDDLPQWYEERRIIVLVAAIVATVTMVLLWAIWNR